MRFAFALALIVASTACMEKPQVDRPSETMVEGYDFTEAQFEAYIRAMARIAFVRAGAQSAIDQLPDGSDPELENNITHDADLNIHQAMQESGLTDELANKIGKALDNDRMLRRKGTQMAEQMLADTADPVFDGPATP